MDDKFPITEYQQRQLMIDLLIRVTAENTVLRETLYGALSQGDPKPLAEMKEHVKGMYENVHGKLTKSIYAEYGYFIPDDLKPD